MQSLLQWGLANSDPEVLKEIAEGKREPPKIDKKWMDIILTSDAEKMKRQLKILQDPNATPAERAAALEEIQYYVETIDNANDLDKIGGLDIVLQALDDPDPDVQTNAIWVLGTCAGNNPEFQNLLLKKEGFQKIMGLLRSSNEEKVKSKCIFAISASMGNFPPAQALFRKMDGFDIFVSLLDNCRLSTKYKIAHVFNLYATDEEKAKYPVFKDLE